MFKIKNPNVIIQNGTGGSGEDRLQRIIDETNRCDYLMYEYAGTNIDFIEGLNTKNVTSMKYMFQNNRNLTNIDAFYTLNIENVTNISYMFSSCTSLKTASLQNTGNIQNMCGVFSSCSSLEFAEVNIDNATSLSSMFSGCINLKECRLNNITSKVTSMSNMFYNCNLLETIYGIIDFSSIAKYAMNNSTYNMFYNCTSLKNVQFKNIREQLTLSNSPNLSFDSVINIIKELVNVNSSRELYLASETKNMLNNVYVRLTDESEEDENNPKLPCVVCESTDEGAMLITEYANLKKWTVK